MVGSRSIPIRPSGHDDSRIAEAIRRDLLHMEYVAPFETLWRCAVRESLATGEIVFPSTEDLKVFTDPSRAWDCDLWPPDVMHARCDIMGACHFLAIANHDQLWLEQLDRCWQVGPAEADWTVFVRGQIQLGRRPGGDPSLEWTEDNIEWFIRERYLSRDRPADRTWLALASREYVEAKRALTAYRDSVFRSEHGRGDIPENKLSELFAFPGDILRLELIALEALVDEDPCR